MINLGLSADDHAAFESTLTQSHLIRQTINIHDKQERIIERLDASVVSGSVQVDATQAGTTRRITKKHLKPAQQQQAPSGPVRTLELTCLKHTADPVWLPDTPGGETVFADNFISVLYGVYVPGLADGPGWVDVPVFWGPITGITQDGEQFTIDASGKDVLGLDPCLLWDTIKVPKGRRRGQGIMDLLDAQGETRYRIEENTDKLSSNWVEGRYAEPWAVAVRMARAGNYQIFYDGLGRACVRKWPNNRIWSFTDGDNSTLLSRPTIAYDVSAARNTVEVVGNKPKGSNVAVRTVAMPPASNPLSAESLGRHGQRRFMVYSEQLNTLDTGLVENTADELLFEMLQATVSVSFDCMTVPHLEEGDRIAVVTDGHPVEFSLEQFTIPLTSTDSMSIGVNRRKQWRQRVRNNITAPVTPGYRRWV